MDFEIITEDQRKKYPHQGFKGNSHKLIVYYKRYLSAKF